MRNGGKKRLLSLVLSAGLTWAIHRVMQGNTPGMDFYIFWLAGRAALTGGNPYGAGYGYGEGQ